MRLQLPDDDDEAEWKIRRSLERRSTLQLHNSLQRILNRLGQRAGKWDAVDDFRRDFDQTMSDVRFHGPMTDVVERMVINAGDLGVQVATDQFDRIGFAFDWEGTNESVREWAARRAADTVRSIDDTTERLTRQAVSRWLENGEGREALIQDLERVVFGRQRAERIASTEITRAFAEGNKRSYQESGVTQRMEWRAAQDERMCPICGALHGQELGFDTDWRGFLPDDVLPAAKERFDLPPAHPNCRCWVVPVVSA